MKKSIAIFGSLFVLLSHSIVSSEKVCIQKKKNNLEQDAMHMLMKKLESLYKLSATDNSEVFVKEIEALKKQIEQLQQHGGVNEGVTLGHALENEAANESTKKTIFGVDEDDLDNYDVDFTGQSKGKIKGQSSKYQKKVAGNDEPNVEASGVGTTGTGDSGTESPPGTTGTQNAQSAENSVSQSTQSTVSSSVSTGESSGSGNTGASSESSQSSSGDGSQKNDEVVPPLQNNGEVTSDAAQSSSQAAPEGPAAPAGQASHAPVPEVKYLDKLYDEVLKGEDGKNGIHIPEFHSKYNDFRKKYELTMNEQEYQMMKKLFDAFFKKGESTNAVCPLEFFKKVLNNMSLQEEFDNFQHGLYGFAKRHNYLRGEKTTNEKLYHDLLKNIINLLNTIEMK
ncbi:MSP7-like protein, putative [Plasmodium knowlesi strain H]|uniref:MSP7-like protein, putative n=4 Tax=Plasmodium knowlesi TaxID=5850 RepID=A0A5K1V5D9_PLAKH|nr:MSP7-like protein [Plasmodium knowlesi strain H]OTN66397.1 putative MSP7-like protein [Plasmodium knowlesi]CAA9989978.1 MSP7-like protein [Plasmodium knowlesi strain H]SBO24567.1 MSP7-like protein, putative [Plasmodium knowlesi strain H]SBO26319.1 MSP7-like protein, putative [Plasmodium knowlesi strain H]VVS79452.1 MSP7-like protein [Plasmodium knowlesi strain H]|eukprot:XP_002259993.1 MSP7-like protein, putative [Plasmodium knowlesi strain H]